MQRERKREKDMTRRGKGKKTNPNAQVEDEMMSQTTQ